MDAKSFPLGLPPLIIGFTGCCCCDEIFCCCCCGYDVDADVDADVDVDVDVFCVGEDILLICEKSFPLGLPPPPDGGDGKG